MSYFSPEYNKDVHNVVLKRCLRAKVIIRALKLTKRTSKRAHFTSSCLSSSSKKTFPPFFAYRHKATRRCYDCGKRCLSMGCFLSLLIHHVQRWVLTKQEIIQPRCLDFASDIRTWWGWRASFLRVNEPRISFPTATG